ncbi:MAG TPA: hypothetical protein VHX15_21110 [Frankiaceae bacterium]|jgi:hypothetical protein|nr:hypothetical protein [Frankiaceae bacterium]
MTSEEWALFADALERVLLRFDALRQGDGELGDVLEATTPKDPAFRTALAKATLSVAERMLEQLDRRDPSGTDELMAVFRTDVEGMRQIARRRGESAASAS